MKVESGRWIVQLRTTTKHGLINRLLAENAINGGKDSNPYFQREEGPGHQPHNKLCCYSLHDGFQPESSAFGFQASTKDEFSKEKFSGIVDYNQLQEKTEAYRCSVIWGKKMGKRSLVIVK